MKRTYLIVALAAANAGLAILIMALFFPAGCGNHVNSGLPTVKMQIGSRSFTLEVADTPAVRSMGLMQRDSMPADHGMIFIFPEDEELGFWMKNTRIPLDIIYVNSEESVVSIHAMQPHDLRSVYSKGPAKYAIELNQGVAAKTGVKPGDKLSIPAGLSAKPK